MGFSCVYFIVSEAGNPIGSDKTQNCLLTIGCGPGRFVSTKRIPFVIAVSPILSGFVENKNFDFMRSLRRIK